MAFWGVEVKPGISYVHHYNDDQGRLHLSQATLGGGSSTKKSILQCNVGDKRPIFLCSLLPEKLETCPLNHEFEEDEEVTFSVIGPHSIHLSGFFFGEQHEDEDEGDSDDFEGHIIESGSEPEDSADYDIEHEDDEDSFDDDDDLDMYPSSPVRKSGVKIEEIVDDDNPSNDNGASKQTKKKKSQTYKSSDNGDSEKQIVVKSGVGVSVLESEDEDGFPLLSPGDEQDKSKGKNDIGQGKSLKRKITAVNQDGERKNDQQDPSVQGTASSPVNEAKLKKKNKKKKNSHQDEMGHETDGKSNISNDVNSGASEQNVEREKEKDKKKKKKKKQENATNAGQSSADKSGSTVEMEEKAEAKPSQVRTFPNGLVVEELAMGKPDGKKAAPGKKVSVRYIGKLKKNGKIFDSNIGRAPFKFRLGIGEVIKGWDVGVNGMRVGDKRRLTIPPAMGYGARGAGGAIPPNSWLVFDVELVDVVN